MPGRVESEFRLSFRARVPEGLLQKRGTTEKAVKQQLGVSRPHYGKMGCGVLGSASRWRGVLLKP